MKKNHYQQLNILKVSVNIQNANAIVEFQLFSTVKGKSINDNNIREK